jgi:hypothetical protein
VLPHPAWFADRGYAVVVQDCRGRGDSTGTFAPFVDEGADGAASIEWAAQQPFCDGRVATYGFSYQGIAQLYAAARRPPSLHAIAPMMCGPEPYEGWFYEGGLLRWPFACFWGAQLAGQDVHTGPIPFDTGAIPITSALGPTPPPWFAEWLTHPADDGYWAARRPDLAAIDVPAFTVLGWFDDFSSGTAALIERLGAEAWCGPWAHMPWGTRHGSVEFGAQASPAPVADALVAFFDRVFGRAPAETAPPRVRYHMIGSGWRDAASWPPPHRVSRWRGLSATGNANSRWGDGALVSALTPDSGRPSTLVAEPLVAHPGDPLDFQDEGPTQDRRDVLCFTSDVLALPVELVGSPVIRARTRGDRPRYDLVATLSLVGPDETACVLTGYARRLLEPVESGQSVDWVITLRPIAAAIPAGSRLRLSLSAARFPCYDRNGHTEHPDPSTPADQYVVATIEVEAVELDLAILDTGQRP